MTQKEAIEKARALLLSRIEQGDFPEDDWVAIAPNWDVNLFTESGQPRASLYPVNDGVTDAFGEIEITLPEPAHECL